VFTEGSRDGQIRGSEGFEAHILNLDGSVVVVLTGEIDMAVAYQFRAVLEEAVTASSSVIHDCAQSTFIDSSGLRELVIASNASAGRGSLTLRNVNTAPMTTLTVSGLTDALAVEAAYPADGG
jgi:anti-anti-sigma factor